MGEVWRAQDTRLGRDVAVKLLPERFTGDAERLSRLEREARALAALSHPNIAAIYETGSENGEHFLVMELVAGETLAARLARGPLPVREAMTIALQIAEALEAAHERGIVHRDLKPANVMLDEQGRVKLLDFGLARALEDAGAGSGASVMNSPTLSIHATTMGVLLGTAAYMSPEQAAGRPADRRADVWAFGVVLMEMLLGRPVFDGETVSHVLASVLKDEPPWAALPAEVSPRLRRLLERCLRRDPRRRLQAIGDARVALEECLAEPAGEGTPAAAATVAAPPRRALLPWGLAVVATLAALALGTLLWRERARPAGAEADTLRLEVPLPAGTTLALGHQRDAIAVSPDGRRQAFLVTTGEGKQVLALRDLGQIGTRLLPGSDDASSPAFSPDGEWIAFFALGRLWRVPVAGGPAAVIAEAPGDNRGLAWSADGHLYAALDSALALKRVSETGGTFSTVTELDAERGERTHRWPHALPGGAVLFTSDTAATTEYYDDARIEVVRPATGERRVVVEQASRARYLPTGHVIFARGGSLFAAAFDDEELALSGTPVIVLQGVSTTVASGAAHFALAENGTLVYVAGEPRRGSSTPQWVRRDGVVEPSGIAEAFHDQLALAPDGRQVAIVTIQGGGRDIWIADTGRGTSTRLTFDGSSADAAWSRDGRWLAYSSGEEILRKRADGSGQPERLWRAPNARPEWFTADDRFLVFSQGVRGQTDLWLLPLGAPDRARALVATPQDDLMAELSPDGRWLAYASWESGRPEVYVRPFSGGEAKWQISTDSGFEPRWSRDGRELFYRDGNGSLLRVEVDPGDAFVAGARQRLFGGMRTGDNPRSYGVSPDGSRVLTLGLTIEQAVDRISLVFGWDREVARMLAPRR